MPPETDALELDSKVVKWIEAFHKLKKWKRVPNPKLRSGAKLKRSPARSFEQRLEGVRQEIGADAIEARIATSTAELQTLRTDLKSATTDSERDAIEAEIAALDEQIAADRMELELCERIAQRIDRLEAVEGDLARDKAATMQKIADLQARLPQEAVNLDTLDAGRVAEFRKRHVEVQRRVDNARAEVMTLTHQTPNGPEDRKYAVVNSTEYKILFGMLEQSVLQLELGELDDAFDTVDAAADLLVTYRNARTGADPIAKKPVLVPELDPYLEAARTRIDDLGKRGFDTAVDDLKTRHETLKDTLAKGVANGETDLAAVHGDVARTLQSDAEAALATCLEIEKLLAEARTDIATMRGNGHVHRPKRAEAKIAGYKPGDSMEVALERAGEIRAYAADKLAETRKDDLRREGMSDKALREQCESLNARFDAFLKTRKDGTRKTRKDDETGDQKLVQKSSKLPDEVVAEIELQLQAAEQLVASGSIDALRMAAGYFDGVEAFIGAIEKDPKIYLKIENTLDAIEKRIGKIEKSHGLYEPGQRLGLKAEVDELRKTCMARPQADVVEEIRDLSQRVDDFKAHVQTLRGRKRALAKTADERQKTLDNIGKLLADRKTTGADENPFDDYHGEYVNTLKTLRDKIAERSEKSLEEAKLLIVSMGQLKGIEDALVRQAKGEALPQHEMVAVYDFVADARQGQKEYDDNQAKKKEFNAKRSEVKKTIAKAIKRTEKLKGDPTELEALEGERTGLVAETKDSGKYIDGLAKMETLLTRANRLNEDAKAAAEILDTDLKQAAAACAKSVRSFRGHVQGFVKKVVEPEGKTDGGNQLDDPTFYDRARIEGLMDAIVKAMPDAMIDRLDSNAAVLSDKRASPKDRKLARKEALLAVRALMGVFDGFDPLAVFRTHPFKDTSIDAHESARKALPRLEVRFLKVSIG